MNTLFSLTRIALVIGASLAPALAQTAAPQAKGGPQEGPRPHHMRFAGKDEAARDEAMSKRLKLTETQKKSLKDIRAKQAEALKAKFTAAQEAQKAFHEALAKPETTDDQLRTLHQKAADAQFEILRAHRDTRNAIRALLTPEQREQWARFEGFEMGRRMGHGPAFGSGHAAPCHPMGGWRGPGPRPERHDGGHQAAAPQTER
ncbi:MAG TPA: Spy/CpxP family protein refolding chaperone [Holophaga sp.]|nr:Spy/CpxP family protein refolding chaperone [Holophaga sp.]